MKSHRPASLLLVWLCAAVAAFAQSGQVRPLAARNPAIPSPETVLGFKIGEDRKLAGWEKFVAYFQLLDAASDRVKVEELGQTTLKRPFIAATISSAKNLERLEEFRQIQRQLSDPRLINQQAGDNAEVAERIARELIRQGKTIVVLTFSIHSTEVGGTFSATELAYRLAAESTPELEQILDQTVIVMVPSLNPDGTDIVADWYHKTLGTPAEGSAPPRLYHHYVGHDNNRDWYAFTQVETQLMVDKVLNLWRPQILHDVHQMGTDGARFFVPPYIDPWEPNIDPAIIAGVNALGATIAWEIIAQGKSGVLINSIFDAWSPARAYVHYHAGLRILSETASARLATPVEVSLARLRPGINYDSKTVSWNFPKPWPGGRWTIRDIVEYQTAGVMALLAHAARYREQHLRNFYEISRRAVEPKTNPYAFLLLEPKVPASIVEAAKRLKAGTKDAKATTEEQHKEADILTKKIASEPSTGEEVNYYYKLEGFDRLIAILKRGGVEVARATEEFVADGKTYPAGTYLVLMAQPYGAFAKTLLESQRYPELHESPGGPLRRPYDVTAHTLPWLLNVEVVAIKEPFTMESRREPQAIVIQSRVLANSPVRVGLYQSYAASMDEGWTRWVFDQYHFPYASLRDQEIRAGNLKMNYDAIILPDQSVQALVEGLPGSAAASGAVYSYPAEYAGGLGEAGIRALREFIEAGGTLITLNNASNFAIERLGVPVRNVLSGVPPRDFYCPGSILRTQLDDSSPLSFGLEKESIAWFEGGPVFELTDTKQARVIARYPEETSPLLSGWISGDKLIRGKAALVEAKVGKGRVVMFGFRPQYRGQSLATLPLLFNAILTSKREQ